MPKLGNYLRTRAELPAAEVKWLNSLAERRRLAKGKAFCSVGQTEHELAFVESGILQVFAPSPNGRNILLDFLFPGMMALALDAAVKGVAAEVVFEAVTPCVLKVWPYRLRGVAEARHAEWKTLTLRMTEEAFSRKQQRYLSLRNRSARERFADLDRELPPEWRLIPQHLLAAYLDITPQYLSRLKNEASACAAAGDRRQAKPERARTRVMTAD